MLMEGNRSLTSLNICIFLSVSVHTRILDASLVEDTIVFWISMGYGLFGGRIHLEKEKKHLKDD